MVYIYGIYLYDIYGIQIKDKHHSTFLWFLYCDGLKTMESDLTTPVFQSH